MSFDLNIVKQQVIAALGLSVRDSTGAATYSTSMGDTTYSAAHLTRSCQNAVTKIMQAIAETAGHPHRSLFVTATALTHAAVIPSHIGQPGIPRITPYSGAGYAVVGKKASVDQINAWRANPNNLYSAVAHNVASNGMPSRFAGRYAIDPETGTFYFCGYDATADLANFAEADYVNLPESYYPDAIDVACGEMLMDGAKDDSVMTYLDKGSQALARIRGLGIVPPSASTNVGTRDSGLK